MSASPLTIAIDGPAASGKGTLARRLSAHYGLPHLDTGLTYRAVALALLEKGLPLDDEPLAAQTAMQLDLSGLEARRARLSDHHVGEAASKVAVMRAVRTALVEAQKGFARTGTGAILDGRDIGTVVLPDATVKLFVTASPGVRAGRRYEEIIRKGGQANYDDILMDVRRRDERDSSRAASPLKPADDAYIVDTTSMTIDTAFEQALSVVEAARGR